MEWGGDSHPGRFVEGSVPSKNDWSESYLVSLIDWHLKEQENMPWLTGTAYWPFKDFSTPVRPENPVPYVNQKGVVERDLSKKESYYVFQSYWTESPMIHIFGHSQPVRWGEPDEDRHRDSQDYPAAGLRWNVILQPVNNKIEAVAFGKKGIPACKDLQLPSQLNQKGCPQV